MVNEWTRLQQSVQTPSTTLAQTALALFTPPASLNPDDDNNDISLPVLGDAHQRADGEGG